MRYSTTRTGLCFRRALVSPYRPGSSRQRSSPTELFAAIPWLASKSKPQKLSAIYQSMGTESFSN